MTHAFGSVNTVHIINCAAFAHNSMGIDGLCRHRIVSECLFLSISIQSKGGIVDGTQRCTREEAVQLAALQCQTQYGDHSDTEHKPGFLNLADFLPEEYIKISGMEETVFGEHQSLKGLSEIDAKFRYIKLCRSLWSCGATFFLVKVIMRLYFVYNWIGSRLMYSYSCHIASHGIVYRFELKQFFRVAI